MNERTVDILRRSIAAQNDDQIDRSGTAIIALLHQAAEAAQADCDRALQAAHQSAMQLRAAEDRAEKLQARIEQLEQEAARAEEWLRRIKSEIEDKLLRQREEYRYRLG